jgi:DMSO/TMAO reductase YedYZ molybdopterin-dependent catalytic subunit
MDEAMHPLTILATGLYGKPLPNQNGAPLRLVVPWKYGFKSIKSIVRSRFVERQPPPRGSDGAARVRLLRQRQPEVDHPRWSQARERWENSCPKGSRSEHPGLGLTPPQPLSLCVGAVASAAAPDAGA